MSEKPEKGPEKGYGGCVLVILFWGGVLGVLWAFDAWRVGNMNPKEKARYYEEREWEDPALRPWGR